MASFMLTQLPDPGIVFLDAWHTLFTVRTHGPQRVALALADLGVTVDDASLHAALAMARDQMKALNLPFVATAQDEQAWYRHYYGFVLGALGLETSLTRVDQLAAGAHYVPYCILYEDTWPALDRLKQAGYRLAVLSNAYPSLIDALTRLGVLDYFELLIVSAFEGSEKPDPAIYYAALRAAQVEPSRALFVDDLPVNIEAANAVGMCGILIDRDGQFETTPLRRITALTELLPMMRREC